MMFAQLGSGLAGSDTSAMRGFTLLHASIDDVRRPVNIDARLGAHNGLLQYAPTKLTPVDIIRSRLGLCVTRDACEWHVCNNGAATHTGDGELMVAVGVD